MTTSERKSRKIYYTMGEVSEMFDVNPSLIRFWEQKFDILKPDKNKKGNRPAAGCRENRRPAQRRSATGLGPLRIRPFGTRPMTRHPVPAKGRGPS